MSGCSLHAINTSLKCAVLFPLVVILPLFLCHLVGSQTHLSNSILASSNNIWFAQVPSGGCVVWIQTGYANLKWSPSKLLLYDVVAEQVLAMHKLHSLFCVYFYCCAEQIAERSGLILLCKYAIWYPTWATNSRLAASMCPDVSEPEGFLRLYVIQLGGFMHDKLSRHDSLERLKDNIIYKENHGVIG